MDGNDDPGTSGSIEAGDGAFAIPLSEQRFHWASLRNDQSTEGGLKEHLAQTANPLTPYPFISQK